MIKGPGTPLTVEVPRRGQVVDQNRDVMDSMNGAGMTPS
jgi:hypothetical protein